MEEQKNVQAEWMALQVRVVTKEDELDFVKRKDGSYVEPKMMEVRVATTTEDKEKKNQFLTLKTWDEGLMKKFKSGAYKSGTVLNVNGVVDAHTYDKEGGEKGVDFALKVTEKGLHYATRIKDLEKIDKGETKYTNVSLSGRIKDENTDLDKRVINLLIHDVTVQEGAKWKEMAVSLGEKESEMLKRSKERNGGLENTKVCIEGKYENGVVKEEHLIFSNDAYSLSSRIEKEKNKEGVEVVEAEEVELEDPFRS